MKPDDIPSQAERLKQVRRVAIVAGETSGDYIAAKLLESLRRRWPNAVFEGIAGPRMQAQGCESLFPMERLAVMGITEVFGRLWELLLARRRLIRYWQKQPPDVFIGVDAPAFNMGLAHALKKRGMKTVHYVSPTVWAWRPGRIHHIGKSVNLMLTLFPFETDIYCKHHIPVHFAGHPLADEIELRTPAEPARRMLELPLAGPVLALLPGSRGSEIRNLASDFFNAAERVSRRMDNLSVVVAVADAKYLDMLRHIHKQHSPTLAIRYITDRTREVIAAADVVLTASGTATLETMLIKRPMVVAYRLASSTYWLARRLVTAPFIAMPNLLANQRMVPEFVQHNVNPENLASALVKQFEAGSKERIQQIFTDIHTSLRQNASESAADAVVSLLGVQV